MATSPVPVWLDCDPGHDDAFALLFAAHHPSIRLLGVSTVFGNAPLVNTTWNATSLLTALGCHDTVAVYPGAAQPLARPPTAAATDIHGVSGLDGTDLLPEPRQPPRHDVAAVDAMAQALLAEPPGTAWLVATGALTNVAQLLTAHPTVADHVTGVSVMGGVVGGGFTATTTKDTDYFGNITPSAEFNIWADPEAAAAVLGHPRVAPKLTLIPLDLTHLVLATPNVQALILHGPDHSPNPMPPGKTPLRTMLVQLLTFFGDTYRSVFGFTSGPPLHDPLAVVAVLTATPDAIPFYDYPVDATGNPSNPPPTSERYAVHVVTDGSETGRTVVRLLPPGDEGVRIPRGLDIPRFWSELEACCTRADAAQEREG